MAAQAVWLLPWLAWEFMYNGCELFLYFQYLCYIMYLRLFHRNESYVVILTSYSSLAALVVVILRNSGTTYEEDVGQNVISISGFSVQNLHVLRILSYRIDMNKLFITELFVFNFYSQCPFSLESIWNISNQPIPCSVAPWTIYSADSRPSQWEMALPANERRRSNAISHWLGPNQESALI